MPRDLAIHIDGWTRPLLAAGIAAGPLFMAVVLIQATTRAGFDLSRHPASLLSVGELGWIQVANFLVAGLLVIAFAVGARQTIQGDRAGTSGPLLLGAYGAGLLVAGLFSPDPAFGFPPGGPDGVPESISVHAALHGVGFSIAFLSVTLAALVLARRDLGSGSRLWAVYAAATAVISLALSQWPSLEGASVRYLIAAALVWAWMTIMAARFLALAGRPNGSATTS